MSRAGAGVGATRSVPALPPPVYGSSFALRTLSTCPTFYYLRRTPESDLDGECRRTVETRPVPPEDVPQVFRDGELSGFSPRRSHVTPFGSGQVWRRGGSWTEGSLNPRYKWESLPKPLARLPSL